MVGRLAFSRHSIVATIALTQRHRAVIENRRGPGTWNMANITGLLSRQMVRWFRQRLESIVTGIATPANLPMVGAQHR